MKEKEKSEKEDEKPTQVMKESLTQKAENKIPIVNKLIYTLNSP